MTLTWRWEEKKSKEEEKEHGKLQNCVQAFHHRKKSEKRGERERRSTRKEKTAARRLALFSLSF